MNEIEIKYEEVKITYPSIGDPTGPEGICADGVGHFRHYSGGSIFWHPGTEAHLIYGLIKGKWVNLQWENSVLHYPVTDESDAGSGRGRYNNFQYGTIIWENGTAEAFAVFGPILADWARQNWDSGALGFPVADEQIIIDAAGIRRNQRFEGGEINVPLNDGDFIKSSFRNEIYKIQNRERHLVPDPETLLSMTTFDAVIVLLDAEVSSIPLGAPIDSVIQQPVFPEGSLLTGSLPEVYVIENGNRRWIPDWETFLAMGFIPERILHIPDAQINRIPLGSPLPHSFYLKSSGKTNLQFNRWMESEISLLTSSGILRGQSRTWCGTWFGGFKGVAFVIGTDNNNDVLFIQCRETYANGTAIGESDNTVQWMDNVDIAIAQRTDLLTVIHGIREIDFGAVLDNIIKYGGKLPDLIKIISTVVTQIQAIPSK